MFYYKNKDDLFIIIGGIIYEKIISGIGSIMCRFYG
jgi:hypothetical protein